MISIGEISEVVAQLERERGRRPDAFLITPRDLKTLEAFCKVKVNEVDGLGYSAASLLGIPLLVDPNAPTGRPFPLYDTKRYKVTA